MISRDTTRPRIAMVTMPDFQDRLDRNERDVSSRLVMDAEGSEWLVREVDTPQAWAHGARCLIFSSSSVVRRVWHYPSGWAGLSSRALLDLAQSGPAS
jgi:hypothetical protein